MKKDILIGAVTFVMHTAGADTLCLGQPGIFYPEPEPETPEISPRSAYFLSRSPHDRKTEFH